MDGRQSTQMPIVHMPCPDYCQYMKDSCMEGLIQNLPPEFNQPLVIECSSVNDNESCIPSPVPIKTQEEDKGTGTKL